MVNSQFIEKLSILEKKLIQQHKKLLVIKLFTDGPVCV